MNEFITDVPKVLLPILFIHLMSLYIAFVSFPWVVRVPPTQTTPSRPYPNQQATFI